MGGLKYVLYARMALVFVAVFGYGAYASFHIHASMLEVAVGLYCACATFFCLLAALASSTTSYEEWSLQQWRLARSNSRR